MDAMDDPVFALRFKKRIGIICIIESTDEFKLAKLVVARDGGEMPPTPTHDPRALSKRGFDKAVQNWRRRLKQIAYVDF